MTPFKIAIASGKGGTGKTTVSVNLSYFLSKHITQSIQLVDCDVEEPNDALFFPKAQLTSTKEVTQLIPFIETAKCTFCRKCTEYCEFNAIVVLPTAKFAQVNASLCHSCGACLHACEFDAITENPEPIGTIRALDNGIGSGLVEGRLNIGSAMQTMLIRELKSDVSSDHKIIIYDAPPGTSCPVVETVADADYTMLVTEPTPFGLHDLRLTVDLLKDINVPFGVVVNKAGLGNSDVFTFLKKENIELLGELPFEKSYAKKYASGKLLEGVTPEIEARYMKIIDKIVLRIDKHDRDNNS